MALTNNAIITITATVYIVYCCMSLSTAAVANVGGLRKSRQEPMRVEPLHYTYLAKAINNISCLGDCIDGSCRVNVLSHLRITCFKVNQTPPVHYTKGRDGRKHVQCKSNCVPMENLTFGLGVPSNILKRLVHYDRWCVTGNSHAFDIDICYDSIKNGTERAPDTPNKVLQLPVSTPTNRTPSSAGVNCDCGNYLYEYYTVKNYHAKRLL